MNQEIENLQGTWNIVALEVDGKKMPASAVTGSKIVVKGDRFSTIAMGAAYQGTLEVDAGKSPRALNMKFTEGPEKGNTNFAIYELDEDTWTICINMTGRNRPTEFATAPGSGQALETLKRQKEAPVTKTPLNVDLEPVPELEGEWRMVSCVRDGFPLDSMMLKHGRRVAKGNETTTLFGNQVFMKARYAVDRTKEPKTIDFFLADGQTQYGIYELDGANFKVCFAAPGQLRPTEFTSTQGDGRTLTVWSRVKK